MSHYENNMHQPFSSFRNNTWNDVKSSDLGIRFILLRRLKNAPLNQKSSFLTIYTCKRILEHGALQIIKFKYY